MWFIGRELDKFDIGFNLFTFEYVFLIHISAAFFCNKGKSYNVRVAKGKEDASLLFNLPFKLFKFCIEKDFFENDIYNVVSNNFTVNQIIKKIKKLKKNIKITYINSAIMNQLSYHVDKKKLLRRGLFLNSNLDRDIENTLNLFENIKK